MKERVDKRRKNEQRKQIERKGKGGNRERNN